MAKILVVDDDAELVETTKILLESKGYTVVTAPNGEEGYRAAVAEKPDLMLLDVMMSHDSEGFDIAQRLNADAQTKRIPVILITGIKRAKHLPFSFEPDEDWLPVKAVMDKPVRPEDLLKKVAEVLPQK